jgi:hypothetical protein
MFEGSNLKDFSKSCKDEENTEGKNHQNRNGGKKRHVYTSDFRVRFAVHQLLNVQLTSCKNALEERRVNDP